VVLLLCFLFSFVPLSFSVVLLAGREEGVNKLEGCGLGTIVYFYFFEAQKSRRELLSRGVVCIGAFGPDL